MLSPFRPVIGEKNVKGRSRSGSGAYPIYSHFHWLVTGPHLNARESGKCRLAMCPQRGGKHKCHEHQLAVFRHPYPFHHLPLGLTWTLYMAQQSPWISGPWFTVTVPASHMAPCSIITAASQGDVAAHGGWPRP